ncbi:MAG: CehA/McbA family metallohydrolase [Agriterribacter sp.]
MKPILILCLGITISLHAIAQKTRVDIRVTEAASGQITPAMVCITNLDNGKVYTPPYGDTAGAATYPAPFFKGIAFSSHSNWCGPVRKMKGKGAVNGQRTYVYGEKPTLPYWTDPVMYQVNGEFSIPLFPGKWSISIQHGNEFIPVKDSFVVSAGQASLAKQYQLKRWIDLPSMGWYSGDVHAHHAMGEPEFKEYMLQMAKAEDVHLLNLLEMGDRNATAFNAPGFGAAYNLCREDRCIVFGQEEPRSDYGHIIGLNIEALARDTAHYNYYDLVFEKLHSKNETLVGYAHFAYKGEGVTKGMAMYAPGNAIDFVELMQNAQINTADYYDYLNLGFRMAAAAGSDFPWGSTIGDCRTFAYTGETFSAAKWFAALKAGNSFVSNGPALFLEVDGKIPGMELHKRKGGRASIAVKALSDPAIGIIDKVEIHSGAGLIYSINNPQEKDSVILQFSYKLRQSDWVTAVVYCRNGAIAHTSPVYCIVNNRPVFNKKKAPALIKKQQLLIEEVRKEESSKSNPDKGILMRLDAADRFYKTLQTQAH